MFKSITERLESETDKKLLVSVVYFSFFFYLLRESCEFRDIYFRALKIGVGYKKRRRMQILLRLLLNWKKCLLVFG